MKLQFNPKEHAYWLDGRRCKGATTVAKIPDDLYKINQWRLRMAIIGAATKPGLAESIAAHHDQRDKVEEFADLAIEYAKANDASRRGSDAHRITERIDLGQDIIDTPLAQAVRAAWGRALDDAGLEVIPEYVERIVVYPEHRIAGTFDRICRRRSDGQLVVVDLKTGENVLGYPHAIAIQLAIYANAPLLAGPLPSTGGTTQHFEPLPELDKETGYVVHMPAESQAEVVEFDIAAGWDIVNQAVFPILKWRARKDLAHQMISAAVWAPSPRLVTEDGTVEPTQPPVAAPVPSTTLPTAERVEWIRTWIRVCADHDHLARIWPDAPVPTNGGWRKWTNHHISLIAKACADVDAANGADLYPADPFIPTPTSQQTKTRTKTP